MLLPRIIFWGFIIFFVGGFLLIVLRIVNKTKNSYWKGKVTDKLLTAVRENMDDQTTTPYYTLVVKTDDGLTRKIAVRKEMYDAIQVGDTLEKPLGQLNPVKIA